MVRYIDSCDTLTGLFRSFPKPANDLMVDVYLQQHLTLTRHLLPIGIINILAALIVAVNMMPVYSWLQVSIWTAGPILFGLLQIQRWFAKRHHQDPEEVSGKTLRQAEWICLAYYPFTT